MMTSETINPKSTSAAQVNGICEKVDSDKGKMSFAKVLLSGDNSSSKGTIVYSSASNKNTKPPSDIDSSSVTNGNSNKGNRNSKKKNSRKSGHRAKNDIKTIVNDKLQESINDMMKEKMAISCEGNNKNNTKIVLSPAPMPTKNAWFSGNSENLRKNLILEKEAKCSVADSSGVVIKSTTVQILDEKDTSKQQNVKIDVETNSLSQKGKKMKNNNEKGKDNKSKKIYENSGNCEETGEESVIEQQTFVKSDIMKTENNAESAVLINNVNTESLNNGVGENVDNQYPREKSNRKKMYSKTIKKHHESSNITNQQEDDGFDGDYKDNENNKDDTQYCYYDKETGGYYYQNHGHQGWKKNGKNANPSPSEKSNSPGLSVLSDYIHINGESINDDHNSRDGTQQQYVRRSRNYRGRSSSEYNSVNYYENRGNRQNNYGRDNNHLQSWGEGGNPQESSDNVEEYVEQPYENHYNIIPPQFYALPPFDATKAAEATAAVVPMEPQLLIPIQNMGQQTVLYPADMAAFNRFPNQHFIPTTIAPIGHVPYNTYFHTAPVRGHMIGSKMSTAQVKDCIVRQIEYYLSEENLPKDFFIRRKMDAKGYISLSLIAGFPKIQNLTDDMNLIVEAMKGSRTVELSEDCKFIRTKINPEQWPLLEEVPSTNEATTNTVTA
uniref:HTH La-type RNA-binding domain-containing protein n=1 Tax=Parastrongyloides trichosuri TaxID=131310 RepID=A0A0N4ZNI8_PARTI